MNSLGKDINFKPSKFRIIKNLAVISSSFVLLFSGFDGLSALQSTMNKEEGVGTISQALTYVMFCISAMLLPKYVIQKLGCKLSIIVSQMFYIPWIASNFYPHWITLVPSSMLAGIAASTLWSGQCTYFNKASVLYCSLNKKRSESKDAFKESTKSNFSMEPLSLQSSLSLTEPPVSKQNHDSHYTSGSSLMDSYHINYQTAFSNMDESAVSVIELHDTVSNDGEIGDNATNDTISKSHQEKNDILDSVSDHEAINARFFGCHSLMYRTAEIWSNLMSYYILKTGSKVLTDVSSCSCGAYFCNADSQCLSGNIGGVSDDKRYLLSGICVALSAAAIFLLILCLDPIEDNSEPVHLSLDIVLATWKQCKKKDQLLLVPLTTLIGLAQGFYTADVTKAYIGCAWGTFHIGLVTVSYGACCAITSSVSGWLVKHIGRIPIMSLGIVTVISTMILLLIWTPNASQSYVFYLIASLWGVMIGTMWSQLPAFYGVLFKEDEEAAFASFYVWQSLGWTISLVSSTFLCTYIKIYALIFVACVGIIGYYFTERNFTLKKNVKSQK